MAPPLCSLQLSMGLQGALCTALMTFLQSFSWQLSMSPNRVQGPPGQEYSKDGSSLSGLLLGPLTTSMTEEQSQYAIQRRNVGSSIKKRVINCEGSCDQDTSLHTTYTESFMNLSNIQLEVELICMKYFSTAFLNLM